MLIKRNLIAEVRRAAKDNPVVCIVGPRQSGKTTLAQTVFPKKPYVTLEDPDTRAYANEDPRGFLENYAQGAIFDEAQRVPHLFSYLQGVVDADPRAGRFVLTGSQHFLLMRDISQSLAGRAAILTLLPLSLEEVPEKKLSIDSLLHRGFYPRLHAKRVDAYRAMRDYFQTYVERDVRDLLRVQDLQTFETFVRVCAGRVGQLLNLASLAADVGISATTARDWLGLLETSFIAFRLLPYSGNYTKRLVKTPKLYFYDVGLATYLCGIEEERHLINHPLRGQFFENMIVSDLVKRRMNKGLYNRLLFFRDSAGNEVDVLYPDGTSWIPIEIKLGQTISGDDFRGFTAFQTIQPNKKGLLVYGGEERQTRTLAHIVGFRDMNREL